MPLRLIFMGTPEFAVPTLRALHEAGHEMAVVYTREAKPAKRGQRLGIRQLTDQLYESSIPGEAAVFRRAGKENRGGFLAVEAGRSRPEDVIGPAKILVGQQGIIERGIFPRQLAVQLGHARRPVAVAVEPAARDLLIER